MSNPNPTVSLKAVINKQKTKVLFAEANTDFVNVLLSFLALPLGKVATTLRQNHSEALGTLTTLYTGLSDLDDANFATRGGKQMLLNPRTSLQAECRNLAVDVSDSPPGNIYYVCPIPGCREAIVSSDVSMYSDIATCGCGRWLNKELRFDECLDGVAFVTNPSSFIVTDDLRVVPAVLSGIVQTLTNLGIADIRGLEMKNLSFGIDQIKALLYFSLTSSTPLTDMIIKKTQTSPAPARAELGFLLPRINDVHSRKMVLKACLHKSTNKFLFAEATGVFVELLVSFLTIPLGGVEPLLGEIDCLKSINNLYKSVSNGIDDKCFATADTKNRLINPKLPHGYISKNQFLPLSEDSSPELYFSYRTLAFKPTFQTVAENGVSLLPSFKSSEEMYFKKQTTFLVTDDLTVSPRLSTSISILIGLGIPLCDVKEMELCIGVEEALRILKASLTSKTVLTDSLIKPMLDKLRTPIIFH